jgi:hypothetical protein
MARFCDGCDPEMPRSSAFVESDLEKRRKFGFGPFEPAPAPRNFEIYDKALRSLGVSKDSRERCEEELDRILRLYRLDKLVEQQETPGRKAQAFQKEQRWRKQRERSRKRAPRLPPGLLQEMYSEVLRGRSPDGALLTDADVARLTGSALAELSRKPSNPGRIKSRALMYAVRRLQDLASATERSGPGRGARGRLGSWSRLFGTRSHRLASSAPMNRIKTGLLRSW